MRVKLIGIEGFALRFKVMHYLQVKSERPLNFITYLKDTKPEHSEEHPSLRKIPFNVTEK